MITYMHVFVIQDNNLPTTAVSSSPTLCDVGSPMLCAIAVCACGSVCVTRERDPAANASQIGF